ncbi:hypothetical protein ABW20_dc0105612 [Dactylellina cionopaga]|nr:hypothetical protein ABW20_dc0105612 [Dactylellina cionopaga]
MGIGMSTIIQWTVIVSIIGAYFFFKRQTQTPATQKIVAAKISNFLDDTSGNEKKKRAAKKDKKQQKPATSAPRDLQVPKVTLESESNEDIPDSPALAEDKGSLLRLAGFKAGQGKTNKPEPKPEKKKADKQGSKATPTPEVKLTPVPTSPSIGAISSTSSTTGADADIDSVDEGNLIDDMLEKTTGPSVMRITSAPDEFTTVTRKKGNPEKKDGPTALQKKNQKKNEVKKEIKKLEKEDQLKRLEAHKREQRLAREAEVSKHPKKNQAAPASSAWSGSNTPLAGGTSQPNVPVGFLDTFDSSNSANSRSGITPSSSDVDSSRLSDNIPQEHLAEHFAALREFNPENEWVEVKPRQKKKKPAPTESETDSDANLASSAAPAQSAAAPQKPKKQFTEQDLKIPSMPPNDAEGWDAHAW